MRKHRIEMKKLGLIVNPIAGMGGAVGLKGTDGTHILEKSIELGASPRSGHRTIEALHQLSNGKMSIQLLTCAGEMGEAVARESGFSPKIIYTPSSIKETTSADTRQAAEKMMETGVDLLLFSGGDGTARDIYSVVENKLVTLGIPSGVKIHSAVYAANPQRAGQLALQYLTNQVKTVKEAEVMDIDEECYREEILCARLFGYLRIPYRQRWVQALKSGSPESERYNQDAIAADVIERINQENYYLIGPGTTTRALLERLGLSHSLLGIDLLYQKKLLGKDLNEKQILSHLDEKKSVFKLIVTPVGGQGFILGRGNLQLSASVLKRIGKKNIIIIATKQKINSLLGQPLLLDSGDEELDVELSGYYRVITGYHEEIIYRVSR